MKQSDKLTAYYFRAAQQIDTLYLDNQMQKLLYHASQNGIAAIEKEFRYARKKIRANVSKKEAPVRSALSEEAGPVGAGHAAAGGPSRPPEWSQEQAGTSCT